MGDILKPGHILRVHFKLGYTWLLVLFDVWLLAFLALDVAVYKAEGLSVQSAWDLPAGPGAAPSLWNGILFLGFMLLALPAVLAILKASGVPVLATTNVSKRPWAVVAIHFAICVLFVYAALFTRRMELISGWKQVDGEYSTRFVSTFQYLVASPLLKIVVSLVSSAAGAVSVAVLGYFLVGGGAAKPVRQYAVRATLADLPRELKPAGFSTWVGGAHQHPRVPEIRRFHSRMLKEYSNARNSKEATAYIDGEIRACRTLIRDHLMQADDTTPKTGEARNFEIELYEGIGRAFEAALQGPRRYACVIVSPYSRDSVGNLAESYCSVSGARFVKLPVDHARSEATWQEQADELIEAIKASQVTGPAALVLLC
jgi:hypothetical protein